MSLPDSDAHNRRLDAALLVLRVGAGLSLFYIFGLPKLHAASAYLRTGQWTFVDFDRAVGLPAPVVIAFLQTLNESIASVFLAAGLLSRLAAGCLTLGFAVATCCSLKVGEPAWIMAFYFFLMFLTLLLTGPGRFSLDRFLRARRARKAGVETPET